MQQVTTGFTPDFVTTMRRALDTATNHVPVPSRTPATKAKMAQRIVRSAHEGITDPHQRVAIAVAEGMVPALWGLCLRVRSDTPVVSISLAGVEVMQQIRGFLIAGIPSCRVRQ